MTFKTDLTELADVHTYIRPHLSKGEKQFITRFVDDLPNVETDGFGNRIVKIGDTPNVLFSCHTDTVHSPKLGHTRQAVSLQDCVLSLVKDQNGYVLGADDGAGVWLSREMIKAKVPGLYIFHRGEEHGGLGSSYIAHSEPETLDGIDFAIAFDRKGTRDIITHQGGRTASDTFAQSLADAIPLDGFRPDDTGLFTDTANYSGIVSECTNISVGYEGAHTKNETLDVTHLVMLRDALVETDWKSLTPSRDPAVDDYEDRWTNNFQWGNYIDQRPAVSPTLDVSDHGISMEELVREYPEMVASILEQYGVTCEDLKDEIYIAYGEY